MESRLDEGYQTFAAHAKILEPNYADSESSPWAGSPFEWIRRVPSRSKGAIGEVLVANWATTNGFTVDAPKNSGHDRIIGGHKIEIKMSTLWKSGTFKFQQIRDQDYEFAFCVGISPFQVEAWLLPKKVLQEFVIGHMGQHTGAGGSDTSWISFRAGKPFDWMQPYGPTLQNVSKLLSDAD